MSLRRALLLWLLLPLALLVPLATVLMYELSVRPALDSLDRALTTNAAALSDMLEVHDGIVSLPLSAQTARALRTDPFDAVDFAVADPQARLLVGNAALARLHPPLGAREWRFFDALLDGRAVRVAAYGAPCDTGSVCSVLVSESGSKRSEAQRAVLTGAGLTALLIAAALVALGVVAVTRGLRPLLRLSQDIEHRSLDNLQPIAAAGVPPETAGIVVALNRLLERLQVASLAQQSFLADAAHQLRTPLTALRTESELALLEGQGTPLAPALQRINAGAARAARLANQLLALARTDGAVQTEAPMPLDLRTLCTEAAEDWLRPALDAGIDLGFELQPAPLLGHAHLLRELLGNLLHNAIEYAGRGANVTVRCGLEGGQAVLEVEDNGPGIPGAERHVVWQRFRRGTGARGSGSGLGLAIVNDIARVHGAVATLGAGEGGRGLRVRVDFPVVPA